MTSHSQKTFEVERSFPVRTYDIDFAGVVSNIVYIRWLEDLRLTVLEEYYPLERFLDKGVAPTLLETNIRYLRPITIREQPLGRMWIGQMRKLKLVFNAEFSVDGELTTLAEQSGCLIDLSTGRPVPLPDELRERYLKLRGQD